MQDTDTQRENISETQMRIREFIYYLGIEVKSFEMNCKLSNGFVSKIGNSITTKSYDKILSAYPDLNINWVKTGLGDMVNSETSRNVRTISSTYQEGSIPIYDIEINAGTVSRIIDDNNNIPIAGWLYMKDHPNTTGLMGVKAVGDSMATFINGGDTMLIRKLENYDFIPPGHAYVVISDELSIVKYVRNGKDDDHWTLRSHNDKYEDFPVKRKHVRHLFIVVKVIKDLNY